MGDLFGIASYLWKLTPAPPVIGVSAGLEGPFSKTIMK